MSFKFLKKKEDNAVTRKRMKDEFKSLDNMRDKEKNYYKQNGVDDWLYQMHDLMRPITRTINVPHGVTIRMNEPELQPRRGYQPDDHAEHVAIQQANVQNQMQYQQANHLYQEVQQHQMNAQAQAQQYQGAGQIITYTGQDRPAANTWITTAYNPGTWGTVQLVDGTGNEGDEND